MLSIDQIVNNQPIDRIKTSAYFLTFLEIVVGHLLSFSQSL